MNATVYRSLAERVGPPVVVRKLHGWALLRPVQSPFLFEEIALELSSSRNWLQVSWYLRPLIFAGPGVGTVTSGTLGSLKLEKSGALNPAELGKVSEWVREELKVPRGDHELLCTETGRARSHTSLAGRIHELCYCIAMKGREEVCDANERILEKQPRFLQQEPETLPHFLMLRCLVDLYLRDEAGAQQALADYLLRARMALFEA